MMLNQLKLDTSSQAFFRFRPINDKVLVTNQEGSFLVLKREQAIDFPGIEAGKA